MKILYSLLFLVSCALGSQAATITSTASGGTWLSGSTWEGGLVPGTADEVIIAAGASVITGANITCGQVQVWGTLTLSTGSFIVNGDLLINPTGDFKPNGRSFVINGNFVNNGRTDLSTGGSVIRMSAPAISSPTSISGTGIFTTGVVRTLRIDNPAGVTLLVPLSVSGGLELWRGEFNTGGRLILDNLNKGSGTALPAVTIYRQHLGSMTNSYTTGPSTMLNISYLKNGTGADANISAGTEIPSSKTFNALIINNAGGVTINEDLTLTSAAALTLTRGVVTMAAGKTITCSNTGYAGEPGSSVSFIEGGVALTAGISVSNKVFPIGSHSQSRPVTLRALGASSGTVTVRFSAEPAEGGTSAENAVLSALRRWKGSFMNGSAGRYTGIGINYGTDDQVTFPAAISVSSAPGGYYTSLGTGFNTASTINSPEASYTDLGYYALASGEGTAVRLGVKYSTAAGGDWSASSTWVGGMVPSETDTVVIVSAATVTFTSRTTAGPVEISGILKAASGIGFTIKGNLLINAGGSFLPSNNSVVVNGDFINNGTTNLSTGGTVLRMDAPITAAPTTIGGTGSYLTGVVRTLRIDNPSGVTLSVPLSVSGTLALWRGVFSNGNNLILDNINRGSGGVLSSVNIIRQQAASLGSTYTLNPSATLNIQYEKNVNFESDTINAGNEIPASRVFNSLIIANPGGVSINDNIELNAATDPLILSTGIVYVAPGKSIFCSDVGYQGIPGSIGSYVNGAVALRVGTTSLTKSFPLGSDRQIRKVMVSGLAASTGTAIVRFGLSRSTGDSAAAGKVLYNSLKWEGTVLSGTLAGFTQIGFDYGPYDSVNRETEILKAPALSGSYVSLGLGANTTSTIISPKGVYTSLGYFALGGPLVSYTDKIVYKTILNKKKVPQYTKSEWDLGVSTAFVNPYDVSEVSVDMNLLSPSGRKIILPCFYYSDKGMLVSKWKARFSPQETGTYWYSFTLSKNGIKIDSTSRTIFKSVTSDKDGILHSEATNAWTLTFDSGKPFRGIGMNIGWEPLTYEDQSDTYDKFLPLIQRNGGNFFRTFMTSSNLPIEWNISELEKSRSQYKNTSEIYHPEGLERMDELVKMSDSLGLHMMLMVEWQGNLRPDSKWPYNPYNSINGGPADTPTEFFTDDAARQKFKNRLRYMIARWGYSPAIGMLELMNEVDNAAYDTHKDEDGSVTEDIIVIPHAAITAWHAEMAAYLKQIDPYRHIVTTSISHRQIDQLFNVPDIDINQEHFYNRTDIIPGRLIHRLNVHSKPMVAGEFAYMWQTGEDKYWNDFSFHLKKGLWYGLFSPTPVLPLSWWWILLDDHNGFSYFKGVEQINDLMLEAGDGVFLKTNVTASGILASAVKCGEKYFVHLLNNDLALTKNSQPHIGSLAPNSAYSVQIFDPETFHLSAPVEYSSSADSIIILPATTFAPKQQSILVLTKVSSLSATVFDFNATRDAEKVMIAWTATKHKNDDRFEIQRSQNARDFEIIAVLGAKGESGSQNYFTYDQSPSPTTNYYRLVKFDKSGKAALMATKAIDFSRFHGLALKAFFQNDGSALHFHLPGHMFTDSKIHALITDVSGRTLVKQSFRAVQEGGYVINMPRIPARGLYVLTVTDGKIIKSIKILY